MKKDRFSTYYFYALILLLLILVFFIVKPYVMAILTGIVLVYVFKPLYNFILKFLKNKHISSLVTILLIIIIILIPIFLVLNTIVEETSTIYAKMRYKVTSGTIFPTDCDMNQSYCSFFNKVNNLVVSPHIKDFFAQLSRKAFDFVIDKVSSIVVKLPSIIINLLIMFFTMHYFFIEGDKFYAKLFKILPIKDKQKKKLFKKIKVVSEGVVYGQIVTAIVQGLLAVIGYYLFGVTSPWLLGILTAFTALIPVVGTGIVWVPLSVYLFLQGVINNSSPDILRAIGLFAYCSLIVSLIDNFVKPKIISDKTRMHPLIILLGVLGGLAAFGVVGVFIGPLVLAIMMEAIIAYEKGEFRKD